MLDSTYSFNQKLFLDNNIRHTSNVDGSSQRQNHGTIQFLGVVWDENDTLGLNDDAWQLRLHFPAAETHDEVKSRALYATPLHRSNNN